MEEKRIHPELEKAAKEYADSIAQSEERKTYCAEDFIAGALWMVNNPTGGALLSVLNKGVEIGQRKVMKL